MPVPDSAASDLDIRHPLSFVGKVEHWCSRRTPEAVAVGRNGARLAQFRICSAASMGLDATACSSECEITA
jgi:hypothetical protein